jgi:hypothetical protein
MKKIALFSLTLAMALFVSGFAVAGMNHEGMGGAAHGSMHDNMQVMHENLQLMKQDVQKMKDPAAREAAMQSMNKHMMSMHHGMSGVEKQVKESGNAAMQKSMKKMNMDMMTTMKGMGMMKKDADAAIPMMMDSLEKMESTMNTMQGMM